MLGNWESVKLGNCEFSPEAVKAGNETGELSDTELGNSKIDGRQTKLGKSISLDPTLTSTPRREGTTGDNTV